jgi:hypothetical protein
MSASGTLLFWLLAQAEAAGTPTRAITWSSDLGVRALSEIAAQLAGPMANTWVVKTPDESKVKVKTCNDFLKLAKLAVELPTEHDWATYWSQGARCFALEAIKTAKPAARSHLGRFRFSSAAIGRLPAGLALRLSPDEEEDVANAEKACRPWGKYDPSLKIRSKSADVASLRADGWTGRLTLYARGDFDGDGWEDLLLRRDAHVTGGSFAETRVFIVSQMSPQACPRVVKMMGAPEATASGDADGL